MTSEYSCRQGSCKVCGTVQSQCEHDQENDDQRTFFGDFQKQGNCIPDTKENHGFLCDEFLIHSTDDLGTDDTGEGKDCHNSKCLSLCKSYFLVTNNKLCNNDGGYKLESTGSNCWKILK